MPQISTEIIEAKVREEEATQHIKQFKLDHDIWWEVHRDKEVTSVNWGIKTTHLWTRLNREMEPDCDTYTLCGHLLPDQEHYWLPIQMHRSKDEPEDFCSKCLGLIEPYRISREMLKDELWWVALDKKKAGLPYNYVPPWFIPAQKPLPKKLEGIYQLCLKGAPFAKGDYEMVRDGSHGFVMRYMGAPAWVEERVKLEDRPGYFLARLVVEPLAAHADKGYLRIASKRAWRGGCRLDHGGAEVYTAQGKHKWPKDSACVLTRQTTEQLFDVSFEPRAAAAIEANRRQALPVMDSGDPAHPAYPLAVKINEAARRCLEGRGRVIAQGEERLPFKFIAAKADKHHPNAVLFEGVVSENGK